MVLYYHSKDTDSLTQRAAGEIAAQYFRGDPIVFKSAVSSDDSSRDVEIPKRKKKNEPVAKKQKAESEISNAPESKLPEDKSELKTSPPEERKRAFSSVRSSVSAFFASSPVAGAAPASAMPAAPSTSTVVGRVGPVDEEVPEQETALCARILMSLSSPS